MSTSAGQNKTVLCNICNSQGTLRCKGCNNVRYCSMECQKTDWPVHKLLCSSFKDYESDRPSVLFRRAIFFPTDKNKPEFIWVGVTEKRDYEGNLDHEVPNLYSYVAAFNTDSSKMLPEYGESLLGDGSRSRERQLVQHNVLRNRDLDHALEIICRSAFAVDGSRLNKSVMEVTNGERPNVWKGPFVALRKEGWASKPEFITDEPDFYTDITLEDFRHVVDFFRSYGEEKIGEGLLQGMLKEMHNSAKKEAVPKAGLTNDNKPGKNDDRLNMMFQKAGISARMEDGLDKVLEELSITSRKVAPWNLAEGNDGKVAEKAAVKKTLEERLKSGRKIKGVRISCEGDQRTFRAKKYISVDVPADHPIFTSSDPAPDISQLISLPILVSKYAPDPTWKDRPEVSLYDNPSATFLHLNADPSNDHWFGWAGPEWQTRVGSVLVVRQDGKDLGIQHIDALCEFCQFRMQPLFEASMEGWKTKEDVMSFLTRERFEKFWRGYREEMMRVDGDWRDAVSPYEVS